MFYKVLFAIFLLCIAVQMGYMLLLFVKFFLLSNKQKVSANKKQVSVIICAKNEAVNLRNSLPAILAQRYTNDTGKLLYEVIVVNDASDDETQQVLEALSQTHAHLKIIRVDPQDERTLPGKKFALSKGVAAADSDILLLTDADCTPSSDEWLGKMIAPILYGKEIVLGYGAYRSIPFWLNTFIRWETMHTLIQFSAYAMSGYPYMGVGRNLACTKAALQKAQASPVWGKVPSGDDDLLVNISATRANTAIVIDNAAQTVSDAKASWGEWVRQKQRHFSTAKLYKAVPMTLLGLYASIHALTWLLFFLFLFTEYWQDALLVMGFRSVMYWYLWGAVANNIKEKIPIILLPIMDIGWMVYNFAFSPYIIWKNRMQWK